jgi:hypothetical protein
LRFSVALCNIKIERKLEGGEGREEALKHFSSSTCEEEDTCDTRREEALEAPLFLYIP